MGLTHSAISRSSQCSTTVCGMVHIKNLFIGKSSPCGGSGFPISLSEWSFTICPTLYNCKYNVLSESLNKTFPSFLSSLFNQHFYHRHREAAIHQLSECYDRVTEHDRVVAAARGRRQLWQRDNPSDNRSTAWIDLQCGISRHQI